MSRPPLLYIAIFAPTLAAALPTTVHADDKSEASGNGPLIAHRVAIVVKVDDRDLAADTLTAAAQELGGYFTTRTNDGITFKVPRARIAEFEAKAESLGIVIQRTRHADDLARLLTEQRTRLASRQEVFQRYFEVLATATTESVVAVEREMTEMVQQIELLKGSIRLLEHRLRFAELEVAFRFRERRPPARSGDSAFPWLNTVNLVDLLGRFAYDE